MIPLALSAELASFQAVVTAAAPLSAMTSIQKSVLLRQGYAVIASVDAALTKAAGRLDAVDPVGLPTAMVSALLALEDAAQDQADLTNLRGLLGRAVFNLAQA